MKKEKKTKYNSIEEDKIKKGEKDYRKILEEIKPFIKESDIKYHSTTGEWEFFD